MPILNNTTPTIHTTYPEQPGPQQQLLSLSQNIKSTPESNIQYVPLYFPPIQNFNQPQEFRYLSKFNINEITSSFNPGEIQIDFTDLYLSPPPSLLTRLLNCFCCCFSKRN